MDRGAWWAAVHRVAQSRTRLKQLSMQHADISIYYTLGSSDAKESKTDKISWSLYPVKEVKQKQTNKNMRKL